MTAERAKESEGQMLQLVQLAAEVQAQDSESLSCSTQGNKLGEVILKRKWGVEQVRGSRFESGDERKRVGVSGRRQGRGGCNGTILRCARRER
jgi:hypothetical protein